MRHICLKRGLLHYAIVLIIVISIIAPGEAFALRPPSCVNSKPPIKEISTKTSSSGVDKEPGLNRRDFLKAGILLPLAAFLKSALSFGDYSGKKYTPGAYSDVLQLAEQAISEDDIRAVIKSLNRLFSVYIDINSTTLHEPYYDNPTTLTGSYYIAPGDREAVFAAIANWAERRIVSDGASIYDASLSHIFNLLFGSEEWMQEKSPSLAEIIDSGYWGKMVLWKTWITPEGDAIELLYRITDRNGIFRAPDPLTENELEPDMVNWPDYLAVSGENAWAALALAHTHYIKYLKDNPDAEGQIESRELNVAERIAANLIKMQVPNGGIRYALPSQLPDGTIDYTLWNTISTENSISAYAAFRALYEITGKQEYKDAMEGIESYLASVAIYNPLSGECYFALGMQPGLRGGWQIDNTFFASDCQTWAMLSLGIDKVNEIFFNTYKETLGGNITLAVGKDTFFVKDIMASRDAASYLIWNTIKTKTGQRKNRQGAQELVGLSLYDNVGVVIVEQTMAGVMVALSLKDWHQGTVLEDGLYNDAFTMRTNIELMLREILDGDRKTIGYPYASMRAYNNYNNQTPPTEVSSVASEGWAGLCANGRSPFFLEADSIPMARELTIQAMIEAQARRQEEPQEPEEWEEVVLFEGYSGEFTGTAGDYSCYKDAPIPDLSTFTEFRFEFPQEQNGINVLCRFLPQGEDWGSRVGLTEKHTIENGVVVIKRDEIPLTDNQLANLKQISVHSGLQAWGIDLEQPASSMARFLRIVGRRPKASSAGSFDRRSFVKKAAVGAAAILLGKALTVSANQSPEEELLRAADNRMSDFFGLNSERQRVGNIYLYLPGTYFIKPDDISSVYETIEQTNPDGAAYEERMLYSLDLTGASYYTVSNLFRTQGPGPGIEIALDIGRWNDMPLYSNSKSHPAPGSPIIPFSATAREGVSTYIDPYTGDITDWPDYTPISGPAAQAVLALAHSHKATFGRMPVPGTRELAIAEYIARNLLLMRAENGGVRHGLPFEVEGGSPVDSLMTASSHTRHSVEAISQAAVDYSLWDTMFTEDNLSAYAAFRALYDITGNPNYKNAVEEIEDYMESVAMYDEDADEYYFALGARSIGDGEWFIDDRFFATNSQVWSILCLGIDKVNDIFKRKFGVENASLRIWDTTVKRTGQETGGIITAKRLNGFSSLYDKLKDEPQNTVAVGPTATGIVAALSLFEYYGQQRFLADAFFMRNYVETLREDLPGGERGYPHARDRTYDSLNGWTPPVDVLDIRATTLICFANYGRNIFFLDAPEKSIAKTIAFAAISAEDEKRGIPTIPKSSSGGSKPISSAIVPKQNLLTSIRSSA